MDGKIAIAQPEPTRPAEPLERGHEGPGLAAAPPTGDRIDQARQGVERRVEVRRDVKAQVLEVIARVDDKAEPVGEYLRQAQGQLGTTDASRQRHVMARGIMLRGINHRNMSWLLGRTNAEAGRTGADQVRPRTSAAGRAAAASPITKAAMAATASAKPTSVTSRGRPALSTSPRRSHKEGTPAAPMAMPTVPSRQARPALSEIMSPRSHWKW